MYREDGNGRVFLGIWACMEKTCINTSEENNRIEDSQIIEKYLEATGLSYLKKIIMKLTNLSTAPT
jgi:hypothetical protein